MRAKPKFRCGYNDKDWRYTIGCLCCRCSTWRVLTGNPEGKLRLPA